MGLSIGQIPGNLNGLARSAPLNRGGLRVDGPRLIGGRDRDNRPVGANFFRRGEAEPIRAGFGRNTITAPGAAVLVLGQTIRSARSIVPTVQELRERLRENFENSPIVGNAREANEFQRDPGLRPIQTRRLDPAAQARNFVNAIDEAAGITQARLRGEEPETTEPRASIRINGNDFQFTQAANEQRLNVFA